MIWFPGRLVVACSAGGDGGSGPREHDYLERWCGSRALPWHRADLGFFGAHALSRCAQVARMDSCDPLLATHFLLEKQVEARRAAALGSNGQLCCCAVSYGGWGSFVGHRFLVHER